MSGTATGTSPSESRRESQNTSSAPVGRTIDWLILAVCGVILVAFRMHAFDLPLENDECNYAVIAGRLLEGDRLYVDVWDHQPFGVFVLFASVIALFGDSPEVFRWLATAFSLVSLGLIHGIVRQCVGRGGAIAAAVMFAVASSDPGTAGEGCNREIYMTTLVLCAWYLVMRGSIGGRLRLLGAGAALGAASCIKTIIAVHWLVLAVWIAIGAVQRLSERSRGHRSDDAAKSRKPSHARGQRHDAQAQDVQHDGTPALAILKAVGVFAVGPAVLWLGASLYFGATDRWSEFVDAVFLFNLSYSGGGEDGAFLTRFPEFFPQLIKWRAHQSSLPLWLAGGAATVWLVALIVRKRSRFALPIALLGFAGYIAICLPDQFWPHYYYLMIPYLVIATGVTAGWAASKLSHVGPGLGEGGAPRGRWLGIATLAVVPIALLATQYTCYIDQPLFGLTVYRYNARDFWARAQGENARRVTDPDDSIFVYGNEAAILYYAGRRGASRYTMITGLKDKYPGSDERRKTLMSELERDPPRLLLAVRDIPPFPELLRFLDTHYGPPVGWDCHDLKGIKNCAGMRPPPPDDDLVMWVFARKDQPIEEIDWDWDRQDVGGWFPR